MEPLFPILATIFGTICSILAGMILSKINGVEKHMEQLNGKVFSHITQNGIHESAAVKTNEQIRNLLQTVKVAHERVDRLEEKLTR